MHIPYVNQCLRCLLIGLLLISVKANASDSIVFEGDSLSTALKVQLSFEKAEYALMSVSQESGDFVISLFNEGIAEPKKKFDIRAYKFIDEYVLIDLKDCFDCYLQVEGKQALDQNSPYRVELEYISSQSLSETDGSAVIEVLKSVAEVGELTFRASESETSKRDDHLRESVDLLSSALLKANLLSGQHKVLVEYIKLLLLQLYGELRDTDKLKSLLLDVLNESSSTDTVLSVHSFYGLGQAESDNLKKRELFRIGMRKAQSINEPMLYAKGANLLAINLVNDGNYNEALSLLEDVRNVYSGKRNWRELMAPLHNLSWANLRAGNIPKSISYAAEFKLVAERHSSGRGEAWALYDISKAYRESGEPFEADRFLEQAIKVYKSLPEGLVSRSEQLYGALLQERAKSLHEVGDFDSANDYAVQAREFYQSLGFDAFVADTVMIEGEIAMGRKDFSAAREFFKRSIQYNEGNNRRRLSGVQYLLLAELELAAGQPVTAAEFQNKAFQVLEKTEDMMLLSRAFSQSVHLLRELGANSEAERIARKAAPFIERFGREADFATFLYRRALIESALKRNQQALRFLGMARQRVERNLPKVKRRDLRREYFALQKSIFELSITVMVDAGQVELALRTAESYKARTLNEVISSVGSTHVQKKGLHDAREALLSRVLDGAKSWYGRNNTEDADLLSEMRELSSALERVEVELGSSQVSNSQSSSSQNKLPNTPSVDRSDEIMLYYFLGSQQSWLWVVSQANIELFSLPSESELESLALNVRSQISQSPSQRSGMTAWQQIEVLTQLGNALLQPVKDRIASGRVANLTIVPDGALNGLPFAPLLVDGLSGFLIEHSAVSYLPSAASRLALNRRVQQRRDRDISALLVADPISSHSGGDLAELIFSRQEVLEIKEIFGSRATLLTGENATKDRLFRTGLENYAILHFATHGLMSSQEPSLSGLLFSPSEDGDSYWLAPEISGSGISADLVVLSACESSIGRGVAGEGLMSLSRAFIEGGASHVIGSLWKVEDGSTAQLMNHFYSYLLDDSLEVSKALRQAQIATYFNKDNDWRDPYYWAGFQLQGGWHTLTYGSKKDSY